MPYDIFISYSRRDNKQGRITQLVERIKTDFACFANRELLPFFDQQEILGMEDWRQKILSGLRESRLLLACLSPSYLQSKYCEWEFVEYLKYEIGHLHGFSGVAPIYFVEVPGWNDKNFDEDCAAWVAELRKRQYFDLRRWYDLGALALHETAVDECMRRLNSQIARTIARAERADKSLGNVDAPHPHFIGRTANLRVLRERFVTPGQIGVLTAVNGLAGLGKTALAVEYAHAFAHEYGGGRWQVGCAGKEDLRLAVAELATPIGFEFTDEERENVNLQFERVRRELRELANACAPHHCLLILDNVDRPALVDPAQVARLNGADWLHVLATTRLGENELYGAHHDRSFLPIDELPADDAIALIESYQPDGCFRSEAERNAAGEIVRLLGCFTLAVESAAVYLGQFANDVTCVAFLKRLKKEGLEGLDAAAAQSGEGVLHGERRLTATLRPTLERLGAAEKLALEFAALLPPDQVPLPWLRALVAKTFPEMEHDAEPGYPDPWKNAVRGLSSLRLVQPTDAIDTYGQSRIVRVHRLIQEVVQRMRTSEETQGCQKVLAEFVEDRARNLRESRRPHETRWELIPLAAITLLWLDLDRPEGVITSSQLIDSVCDLGLSRWAEPLFRKAAASAEQLFGPNAWESVGAVSNIALVLKNMERYEEAESLYRQALARIEQGPRHHLLANLMLNLGNLLVITGRPDEGEDLLGRAAAIGEDILPPNHPWLGIASVNRAFALAKSGRYSEAERLLRNGLAIYIDAYGNDDVRVGNGLVDLGGLFEDMGRVAEAEIAFMQALHVGKNSAGPNSPTVEGALIGLANLLHKTGRDQEAEVFSRQAVEIGRSIHGRIHPSVARHLFNLGTILEIIGRLEEAESAYRETLEIDEAVFGSNHAELIPDLANLGEILRNLRRPQEAEAILRRALRIVESLSNMHHPRLVCILNNLALAWADLSRMSEGEPLLWRALAIAEAGSGEEQSEIGTILGNLGELHAATGRLKEAEELLRRALAFHQSSTHPRHAHAARASFNLGGVLCAMERFQEAEPVSRSALVDFARITRNEGREDPNLGPAIWAYAEILKRIELADSKINQLVESALIEGGLEPK